MAVDANGFTPTQARIMHVLSDGAWHTRKELMYAVDADGLLSGGAFVKHIWDIRQIVERRSQLLVARKTPANGWMYCWCQKLASAYP